MSFGFSLCLQYFCYTEFYFKKFLFTFIFFFFFWPQVWVIVRKAESVLSEWTVISSGFRSIGNIKCTTRCVERQNISRKIVCRCTLRQLHSIPVYISVNQRPVLPVESMERVSDCSFKSVPIKDTHLTWSDLGWSLFLHSSVL